MIRPVAVVGAGPYGLPVAASYGPVMRIVRGTGSASPRPANHLAAAHGARSCAARQLRCARGESVGPVIRIL